MNTIRSAPSRHAGHWAASMPLQRFLAACHTDFASDHSGEVAHYIPELSKANPDHFGISLATLDGHVYEVGDTSVPFTIQSISKAFVFALALDTLGAQKVESVIGVEPSGDPFNSIRLNAENHPFNPMVNAGAIACSGLIREAKGDAAFDYIRQALGRFAGRELDVDEAVFTSESATGDRNRAIGYLLRTSSVIKEDVRAVLEVYFRQCSVLVTARDIAIMAALPARLGLGSYSPRLDGHGNSVRGIKVCEALSSHYDLHMLNRSDDARNSIMADYNIDKSASRRSRRPHERKLLSQHHREVRVMELVGTLSFSNVDYVSRQIAAKPRPQFIIFDLRRVTSMTPAGTRLLAEALRELAAFRVTVIFSGIRRSSVEWKIITGRTGDVSNVRNYYLLDTAIEWAEDQIVYRHGGAIDFHDTTELAEQPLLAGLATEELAELNALAKVRTYQQGERILSTGEPATSLFFLRSGVVHVTLPDGIRLATLTAGMAFGEMALLETHRSADVFADMSATAYDITLADFERFRERHPKAGERIMRNLAQLLADRLIVANARVNLLTEG